MSYQYKTWVFEEEVTAAKMNALSVNIRDHVHGQGDVAETWQAGTRAVFRQSAAPTGWTKVTSSSYSEAMLRTVTDGTFDLHGSTAFSSVFSGTFVTQGHAVTTSEMPAHAHTYPYSNNPKDWIGPDQKVEVEVAYSSASPDYSTSNAGGGSAHVHSVLNMNLAYIDVIVGEKD